MRKGPRTMKRFRPNLFALGITLVVIPFFVQIFFVVYFAGLLGEMQKRLESQWKSEQLIRLASQLCRDSTDVMVWMQMSPELKGMFENDFTNSQLDKPLQRYLALVELAKNVPEQKETLKDFSRVATTLFALQREELDAYVMDVRAVTKAKKSDLMPIDGSSSRKLAPGERSVAAKNKYKDDLREFGPAFFEGISKIVSNEEVKQAEANSFGASTIASLHKRLLVFILLSTAVTALLGFVYAFAIRRPLRHLNENARLLSRREALLPPIGGNDAFGKLDTLLHQTSKGVETALQRERAAIENAADVICTIDEKGNFLSINPFVERLLGYRAEELVGKPASVLAQPEHSLLIEEYVRSAISNSELTRFEVRLQSKKGDVIDTAWSCIWSQRERQLFCIAHDVSQERAIAALKQDFADMISHDLRSPLMAMSNALVLIERGAKGPLSEEAAKKVSASSRNVEKLIELVNDLLDFQKLKSGSMELRIARCDLESIVRNAAEFLIETASSKNIELVLPKGETLFDCDEGKVTQVVVNLLSNAIKFSPNGTQVFARVETVSSNKNGRNDSVIRLSISDKGPGIPEDSLQRIFEPFEQAHAKTVKEGTGLGLAICKLIVEAHGGTIVAHSSVLGSTFVVEFPAKSSMA